jgi:hypothetical protein
MGDFQSQGKFLGEFLDLSERQWLLGNLRSSSGKRIKMTCQDQILLELMGEAEDSPEGGEGGSNDE